MFLATTEDQYDWVDIGYDSAPADLATRVLRLSGDEVSEPVAFNSDTAWMTFTSDASTNAMGFNVTFYDSKSMSFFILM